MSDAMKASISVELIDEFSSKLSSIKTAFETLAAKGREVQAALNSLSSGDGFNNFGASGRRSFAAVRNAAVKLMTTLSAAQRAVTLVATSLATMGRYGTAMGRGLVAALTPLATMQRTVSTTAIQRQLSQLLRVVARMRGDIGRTVGRIVTDLRRLRNQILALIASLRTLYSGVGKIKTRFEQLHLVLARSSARLLESSQRLRDARAHTDTLAGSVDRLNSAIRTNSSLPPVGARQSGGGSPGDLGGMGGSGLQEIGSSLTDVGGRVKGLGATALGAAGGIVSAAAYTVKQSMSLEDTYKALQNTLDKDRAKAAAEFEVLKKTAVELGNSLPGSVQDMANLFISLRKQGVSVQQIVGGLGKSTAEFAVLNGIGLEQAGNYTVKFAKAFGLDENATNSDYANLIDTITRLNGASTIDSGTLFETIKYLGSQTVNLTKFNTGDKAKDKKLQRQAINDIAAMLAIVSDSGIEGSMAGTNVANALGRMSRLNQIMAKKSFEPYQALLDQKGIKLQFYDANGKFSGIDNAVAQLSKLKVLDDQNLENVLYGLFGDTGVRPMKALVRGGAKAMNAKRADMANQISTASKISNLMSSASQKLGLVKANWETLMASIGDKIAGHFDIAGIFVRITSALQKMIDWVEDPKHQKVIDEYIERAKKLFLWLTKTGVVLTGIGTILSTIGSAIAGFVALRGLFNALRLGSVTRLLFGSSGFLRFILGGNQFTHVFRGLRAAILIGLRRLGLGSILRTFFVTPLSNLRFIGPIVSAFSSLNVVVIAIAAAGILIYKYWDPLKKMLSGFWDGLKQGWIEIQPTLDLFGKIVADVLQRVLDFFGGPVKGDINDYWNGVGAGILVMRALGAAVGLVGDLITTVVTNLSSFGQTLGRAFYYLVDGPLFEDLKAVGKAIRDFFVGIWQGIKSSVSSVIAWIKAKFYALVDAFRDIGKSIMDSLFSGLQSGVQRISALADKIKSAFNFSPEVKMPNMPAPTSWEETSKKNTEARARQDESESASTGGGSTSKSNNKIVYTNNFFGVGNDVVTKIKLADDRLERLNFGLYTG